MMKKKYSEIMIIMMMIQMMLNDDTNDDTDDESSDKINKIKKIYIINEEVPLSKNKFVIYLLY